MMQRLCRGMVPLIGAAVALVAPAAAAAKEPDLLPPEQAFRYSARALDAGTLEARFNVADGYYLYREKFRFGVEPAGASLGAPSFPAGQMKDDEFFGRVETYRGLLVVRIPLKDSAPGQSVVLRADSQGCADLGVCYPPQSQRITLVLPAAGAGPGKVIEAAPEKKSWFN